jgi:colanic acid/amylovoran biosynthesis glycosyltransferase
MVFLQRSSTEFSNLTQERAISVLFVGILERPETFLVRLARGLASEGVKVTLALKEKPRGEWFHHPNLDWLYAPSWSNPPLKRLIGLGRIAPSAIPRTWQILKLFLSQHDAYETYVSDVELFYRLLPFAGRHWDVIYFPWVATGIVQMPLMKMGIPSVVSCRGRQVNVVPYIPENEWIRTGLPRVFQQASAVHCVSEDICREAMKYNLDPGKTEIIRPAVDPDVFKPAETRKDSDKFRVINVASMTWRKAHEFALLAIRMLVDRGIPVTFDIIGDGPELQHLLFTIQDLNLQQHVRLLGKASPATVVSHLQNSDVFLLSSLSEGISNAVLEAMSCGLPVVSTDCGGMREAITSEVEGFLVPLRDAEAIANCLEKLWADPALRSRMSSAARQRILCDFQLTDQIRKFKNLFLAVADGSYPVQVQQASE